MGRSTYSGTAPSALTFEDGYRDHALRPRLVVGERGPDLGHLFEETVPLTAAVDDPGARLELLGPAGVRHLDLDLRIRLDVPQPRWMHRSPAYRRRSFCPSRSSAARGRPTCRLQGPS